MKILALEASAKAASVALCEDEFLIAQSYQNCGLTHSRTLMPMCESLLSNCGLTLEDVDLIACANGPGSFTGLRIGLSTAKGLSWAKGIDCAGVSTLESMAWNLVGFEGVLCCVMDARRKQVYNALFRVENGTVCRLTEDRAISVEALFQEELMQEKVLLVGDGAALCQAYANSIGREVRMAAENLRFQQAYGVARAALEAQRAGLVTGGAELSANYLRLSQAERERNERLAKGQ